MRFDMDKKVNEPQENEEICEEMDCDFCGSTKQVGFVDDAYPHHHITGILFDGL